MQLLRLDPAIHRIRTTEFSRFLAREFGPEFFTYFHVGENCEVVAVWASRSRRLVREYDIVPPAGPTLAFVRSLRAQVEASIKRPLTGRAIGRAAAEQARADLRARQDFQSQYNDTKRFMRRNAMGVGGEAFALQ